MDHHVHVEPMDVDCMDSDFDNKENSYQHSNVLPCTEKGYEELDVSELNMKLRYSITPAASPMSKSYSAYVDKTLDNDSVNCNENANLTRSLNSTMTNNDSVIKSLKNLPLQTISTEQFVDNRNSVLRPITDSSVDNVTIAISGANDNDENVSLPSSSSSVIHTPEATTPTNISKNEEGSPIIRGLKSVFNMFRSSQSPIPPVENDILVKQEVSPLDETYCDDQKPQTLASTPISAHRSRDGSTSKRSSPLKDSIAFSDDLEKELQWKDDTILFSEEKIPIHKLFLPLAKPMPIVSATSHKDKKTAADFNSTVEDMDVSYNNSVMLDNTVAEMLNNTNAVESDGEFEDCETTITKNESLCVESQVEIENDLLSSALEIPHVTKEIVKQNESIEKTENETHKKLEIASKTLDIPGDIIVDNIPVDTENEEYSEKMPLTDADMTLDVTRDMVSALIENVVLSNNEIQKELTTGALNALDVTGEIVNRNATDVNENPECETIEIKKEPSVNTSQRNYVTLEIFREKDIVTDCELPLAIVPETDAVKCDVPTPLRSGETSTETNLDQKPDNEANNDALHNVTLLSVENMSLQGHETETVIESLNVSKENKAERSFEVCKEVTCLTEEEIDMKQSVESEKTTGKVIEDTQNLSNEHQIDSVKNIETSVVSDAKELLNATKDLEELKTNPNADNSQLNTFECPHKDETENAIKASLEDSKKVEENTLFVSDYAAESKETQNENNINTSNSVLVEEPLTISLNESGNEPRIDLVQNIETKVDADVKELHNATKNLEEFKANLDYNADNLHKNEAEKAIKAFVEDSNKIEENTLFVQDYATEPIETHNENNINASNKGNQSILSDEPQFVQNIETNVDSDVKELHNATKNLEEVEANLDSNADLQLNILECPRKNEAEKVVKAFLEDSNKIEENTLFVNDDAAEPKGIHNENNINASNISNQSTLAQEPANISLSYEGYEMGPVLLLNKDKMGTTPSDHDISDSVKIVSNLDVTETLEETLNYNNMIKNDMGELEVLPLPEKLDVLNDTNDIVNSLTEIISESPNDTVSIDISYTMTANEAPSSPPIRSKGYNFNFDEMDDPFAKKSKIRLSPPPTPSSAEEHESKIKKEPEISKKVGPYRRRSQDPERKRPVSKKKFNITVDAISTSNAPNKSNNTNTEFALNNVSVDNFKNSSMTKDVNKVDDTEQVLDKMIEENIDARLENDLSKVELENNGTPAVESTIEISLENKSSIESMTKTTGEIKTSSSEHSTYYSAAASSSDNSISKNVFNLPEIDDKNFNPFATKSKMRESPPLCFENENPFASKSKMRSSPNSSMDVLLNAENIQLSTQKYKLDAEDKIDTELMEKDTFYNISNTTSSSKCTDGKNITTCEVNTEDEDTEEGPFLEAEDVIDKLLDMDDDNMMQFNDIPAQANEENVDGGELFIDAEAFEFLLNQNKSNVVADSGKESLFLKFDPLFAKTISSDGVLAALNKVQKRQSTPTKPTRPPLRNEASPIAGPSTLNATYEGDSNVTQDSIDDLNITVAKPMMVVSPAVNPVVTPRNKTTTPPRSNRRSITFTSPAMAVIDRLLSLSGNNSLMGHDTTITQANREQTEADVALTQLRELLTEKEISVYQLRSESKELKDRLSIMETQVKILEADGQERLNKINNLNDRLAEKTKVNKSMAAVVEEYERTIAILIAETEQDRKRHAEERVRLINERDEQTAHLASMEVSFSDLHSKYEKSKQVILSCKANEETCKKSINDFEANLTKMQTNYEMLKQHATSKLNHANQELQKMNKAHESEVLKLNALIKRKDMNITSLEETLAQKTKANEELTAICDELINKVG